MQQLACMLTSTSGGAVRSSTHASASTIEAVIPPPVTSTPAPCPAPALQPRSGQNSQAAQQYAARASYYKPLTIPTSMPIPAPPSLPSTVTAQGSTGSDIGTHPDCIHFSRCREDRPRRILP